MLSGQALASMHVGEVSDVKGLKQRLTQVYGLPPPFRQRVLLNGESLKDAVRLDSPMNLDLALLTYADVSQDQIDDLAAAARQGSVSKVGSLQTVHIHKLHRQFRKKTFMCVCVYVSFNYLSVCQVCLSAYVTV